MFRMKQFDLEDSRSTMKVGVDAVLLGAWAKTENVYSILEIGTGCGIISLMLAQRTKALIDAIDIDHNSTEQARDNFLKSKWSPRLNAIHSSFQDFVESNNRKYDLIISNPPFFTNSLKSNDNSRNMARHTDSLPHDIFITCAKQLLGDSGSIQVVLPKDVGDDFIDKATGQKLHLTHRISVYPKIDKEANRYLLKFELQQKAIVEKKLTIRNPDNTYTTEYQKLTSDFHPDFHFNYN